MLHRVLRGTARGSTALLIALVGGVVASTTATAPAPEDEPGVEAAAPAPAATATTSAAPSPLGQTGGPGTATAAPTAVSPLVTDTAGTSLESSTFRRDPAAVLYLVNKRWAAPPAYVPAGLVTVPGGERLREPAAQAWRALLAAAARDRVALVPVSGYRSYGSQEQISANLEGTLGDEAHRLSAPPGHSEHQLGLALDVVGADGTCRLRRCFGRTPAGLWLAAHVREYGFIIRYPDGQEARTGYEPEPWHLRYLGPAVAADLTARGSATYEDWVASLLPGAPVS